MRVLWMLWHAFWIGVSGVISVEFYQQIRPEKMNAHLSAVAFLASACSYLLCSVMLAALRRYRRPRHKPMPIEHVNR